MKIFFVTVVSILGAIFATIVLLIAKPELVITSRNLDWAKTQAQKHGFDIDWSKNQTTIYSNSFLEKHFILEFENLKINLPSVSFRGTFKTIKIDSIWSFKNLKIQLLDLGPVAIESEEATLDLKTNSDKKSSSPPAFLSIISPETHFHDLEISIKNLTYNAGDTLYLASMSVVRGETIKASLAVKAPKSNLNVSGEAELNNQNNLKAKFDFGSPDLNGSASVDLKLAESKLAHYKIILNLTAPHSISFRGTLEGEADKKKTSGTIVGKVSDGKSALNLSVMPRTCSYDLDFFDHLKLDCPIALDISDLTKSIRGVDLKPDINNIAMTLKADISAVTSSTPARYNGKISLIFATLNSNSTADLLADGHIDGQFNSAQFDSTILNNLAITTDLDLKIARFENLVLRLKKTLYAIPAPLNNLGGSVECHARGLLKMDPWVLPFQCESNLKSSLQSLILQLHGGLALNQKSSGLSPELSMVVNLNDVQLALPHFGVQGPPPMIPDSRFRKTTAPQSVIAKDKFAYKVLIQTPDSHPLRLLSNLSKVPVPIFLSIRLGSDSPPTGNIAIKEFQANLFRRDAIVKFFNVKLEGKPDESISGLVEVKYTDYTIKINVDGTFQSPLLRFDSVPPLAQDQIISVLLFGRKIGDSTPDQTSSTSNTEAAVADRALALSSMYLLASTPVESVGYDSQSHVFTAKFHLAEGTSLDVGSGGDGVKEIGVNRHLGGPWYIYTYLNDPSDSTNRSTSAFLEWVLRY